MNQLLLFCILRKTCHVCSVLIAVTIATTSGCNSNSDSSAVSAPIETNQRSAETRFDQEDRIAPDILRAIKAGNAESLSALVANGANINSSDENGVTPLMLALAYRKKDCFDLLLSNGAGVDAKSLLGDSAVRLAAHITNDDFWLKTLLQKGANPNIVNLQNQRFLSMHPEALPYHSMYPKATPLFDAVDANSAENVELLLDAGAKIDHKNGNGETALVCAAAMGRYEIAHILISWGAAVDPQVLEMLSDDELLFIDVSSENSRVRLANEAQRMWHQKVLRLLEARK